MKYMLLLTVMLALAFGSSGSPARTRVDGKTSVSTRTSDVEGVTIERQRLARLQPGYRFRRESMSSVAVLKTLNNAAFQTGTLTCTKPGKSSCTVEIGGTTAKCSSGCYFVGVRGGVFAS